MLNMMDFPNSYYLLISALLERAVVVLEFGIVNLSVEEAIIVNSKQGINF